LNLNKYQASVLTFLFEKLPIGQSVENIDFVLRGENTNRHFVAHSRVLNGENIVHVVFTLPFHSTKVFLALTENKMKDVARLLANLEEYEQENRLTLGLGEVVVTPDLHEASAELPYAVVLLPIETSIDCAAVPAHQELAGKLTTFQLIVPVTKEEWTIRKQVGYDALVSSFQASEKSILF
jgi:Suppressor of fused protein (SUFU)